MFSKLSKRASTWFRTNDHYFIFSISVLALFLSCFLNSFFLSIINFFLHFFVTNMIFSYPIIHLSSRTALQFFLANIGSFKFCSLLNVQKKIKTDVLPDSRGRSKDKLLTLKYGRFFWRMIRISAVYCDDVVTKLCYVLCCGHICLELATLVPVTSNLYLGLRPQLNYPGNKTSGLDSVSSIARPKA